MTQNNQITWKAIQLTDTVELVKAWREDSDDYKATATFGLAIGGGPVLIQKVYKNSKQVEYIIDENVDVWKNGAEFVTARNGNEYYKMLIRHGFKKVKEEK